MPLRIHCTALLVATMLGTCWPNHSDASTIDIGWTTIGNRGNAPDPETGRGSIGYSYQISTTEITNSQFGIYLNTVDPDGTKPFNVTFRTLPYLAPGITYEPQNNLGERYVVAEEAHNLPVTVYWGSAARFVNWLHNGCSANGTEDGVYSMSGGGGELWEFYIGVERNSTARYALPTLDEWYKAAYHDAASGLSGEYYDYPASSDHLPDASPPSENPSGYNYNSLATTPVGSYNLASSPYGTFDQGGNVYEWLETYWHEDPRNGNRAAVGGAYSVSFNGSMMRSSVVATTGIDIGSDVGIRIVRLVPEPHSVAMCATLFTILRIVSRAPCSRGGWPGAMLTPDRG